MTSPTCEARVVPAFMLVAVLLVGAIVLDLALAPGAAAVLLMIGAVVGTLAAVMNGGFGYYG